MVLVDTSIWIEVFRKKAPLDLESVVPLDDVVTCLPILQEVLQGISAEREFRIARDAMTSFPIVEDPLGLRIFQDAVDLYRVARRAGRTVRSGVDCLIAACAIRHHLEVLHRDRDFDALAAVSSLETRRVRD